MTRRARKVAASFDPHASPSRFVRSSGDLSGRVCRSAHGVGAGVGAGGERGKRSEPPHELLYKIINFAILVGGLGYILRKPVAEFFSSRSASIQKSLDEGRKALEASQAQLQVVEEKLRGLEAEIAAFKASAAREMEAERQRLQQASAEEAARILESARAQTDTAVRGAKLELKNYAAQKAGDPGGGIDSRPPG